MIFKILFKIIKFISKEGGNLINYKYITIENIILNTLLIHLTKGIFLFFFVFWYSFIIY